MNSRSLSSGSGPGGSCAELFEGILGRSAMDPFLDTSVTPASFSNFVAYVRKGGPKGHQVVVKRAADGKQLHVEDISERVSSGLDSIIYSEKKGRLILSGAGKRLGRVKGFKVKPVERGEVSYNEVLKMLEKDPYDAEDLPDIPIQLFRFFKDRLVDFFVGRRSADVLLKGNDYRVQGMRKPIHPMGAGFEGSIEFYKSSKYSGLFKGGSFPMLGRLSLSQGNASKVKKKSWLDRVLGREPKDEVRSTALAIKVFPTQNLDENVQTANAVFQNDLNGENLNHFLDGVMSNQPQLNFMKIRKSYEIFTLLGVAKGAIKNPNDILNKFPYINPQIRPVHQLAEAMEQDPAQVRVPTWIKIQREDGLEIVSEDDFRREILKTAERNDGISYEIFVSDEVDEAGNIIWERSGRMNFNRIILSRGADEHVTFHHSGMRSDVTGEISDPGSAIPDLERIP